MGLSNSTGSGKMKDNKRVISRDILLEVSQYDLISKEISEYNEKLFEERSGQRREIETICESIMLYETGGGHDTRNSGNVGRQQTRDGSAGGLYQGESASNGGRDNQEGEHHTGHFSIESYSGKASQDLEF